MTQVTAESWVQEELRFLVGKWPAGEVFGHFMESMEYHDQGRRNGCRAGSAVISLEEVKLWQSKKRKGDIWEEFCRVYLLSSQKYESVWRWQEVPETIKRQTKLIDGRGRSMNGDNGIDLIAQTSTGKLVAIQAKYRKKSDSRVPWSTLATFVGLTALSEEWYKHIVMTNCIGVSRKVKRPEKDLSICRGTFRAIKREQWLRMTGDYVEHRLTDVAEEEEDSSSDEEEVMPKRKLVITKAKPELTLEELRAKRLAALEKN